MREQLRAKYAYMEANKLLRDNKSQSKLNPKSLNTVLGLQFGSQRHIKTPGGPKPSSVYKMWILSAIDFGDMFGNPADAAAAAVAKSNIDICTKIRWPL